MWMCLHEHFEKSTVVMRMSPGVITWSLVLAICLQPNEGIIYSALSAPGRQTPYCKNKSTKKKCTCFLCYFNSLRWMGTSESTELFLFLNKIGNVYFSLKCTLFFSNSSVLFYRSTWLVLIFFNWKYKHKVVAKLITLQKWHCICVETDIILEFIR
jgi:hypothetical protein